MPTKPIHQPTINLSGAPLRRATILGRDRSPAGYFSLPTLLEMLAGGYLVNLWSGVSQYCRVEVQPAVVLWPEGWSSSDAFALDPFGFLRRTGMKWPPKSGTDERGSGLLVTESRARASPDVRVFLVLERPPHLMSVEPLRVWMSRCGAEFASDLSMFMSDPKFDPQLSRGEERFAHFDHLAVGECLSVGRTKDRTISDFLRYTSFENFLRLLRSLLILREEGRPVRGDLAVRLDDAGAAEWPISVTASLEDSKLVGKLLLSSPPGTCLLGNSRGVLGFHRTNRLASRVLRAEIREAEVRMFWRGSPLACLRGGELCGVDLTGEQHGFVEALARELAAEGASSDLAAPIVDIVSTSVASGRGCSVVVGSEKIARMGIALGASSFIQGRRGRDAGASLTAADGAIVVGRDGRLCAFACLLDGAAQPRLEQRSRGARHNSVIRFTAAHRAIAVVASVDGGISLYRRGRQVYPLAVPDFKRADPATVRRQRIAITEVPGPGAERVLRVRESVGRRGR